MGEHVRVEQGEGRLSITLSRPERRNAITIAMYAELANALEQAASDPSIRVVTFRGDGQDFAAGNDLMDFLEAAPRGSEEIPVMRFLRALVACETPLVAAVHGNCVGIGTTMLLHCDLVIAEEGARFSLPFVDLGLVPEAASSLLLPWLAGRRLAARHLLLAEPFGVVEAEAMGIISHRAPKGQLQPELERIMQALLAKPAEALRQTQRLLRKEARDRILERIKLEGEIFAERLSSPEVAGAINAFFEKGKRGSNA
ncbi:MAG TPA: enoyl-CoA hydratase-related protein [Sphingomicrobium sp.]